MSTLSDESPVELMHLGDSVLSVDVKGDRLSGSQNDHVEWNFETLEVSTFSHLTHQDVAPLLDALNNRFVTVRTVRSSFDAPAAGPQEVALDILIALGSSAAWELFFSKLAEDAGQRIRSELHRLLPKGRRNDHDREFIPLCIRCGKVCFNFLDDMSEEEFRESLRSARDMTSKLAADLDHPPPPLRDDLNGYVWNRESNLWLPGTYWFKND